MDQGEHEFTYTIFAFESFSDCKRNAQMLNNAPTVIAETFHHGGLETHCSKISVSKENIIVIIIKKHIDRAIGEMEHSGVAAHPNDLGFMYYFKNLLRYTKSNIKMI